MVVLVLHDHGISHVSLKFSVSLSASSASFLELTVEVINIEMVFKSRNKGPL